MPKNITAELGNTEELEASDFLFAGYFARLEAITDFAGMDYDKCGTSEVVFKSNGLEMHALLIVEDTTAPKAFPLENAVHYVGSEFVPESFFSEIKDEQDVSVSLLQNENISSLGKRDVGFVLEDASGNKTEIVVSIDFLKDELAPVVLSNPPIFIDALSEDFSLTAGLEYEDNVSPKDKIKISADDSSVDFEVPGKYAASIVLEDENGNKTVVEREITVYAETCFEPFVAPYDEEIDRLLDEILAEIITDEMTDRQKAEACYNWTVENITYKPSTDYSFMDDIYSMSVPFASRMLVTKKGACFAYAALGAYFMNKLDIPVMLVVGEGSDVWGGFELHCWNQVYCDGQWWHYDPMYEPLFNGVLHFCLVPSENVYFQTHIWDMTKYPWW